MDLKKIINIFNKKIKMKYEIDILFDYLKNLKFFKDFIENNQDEIVYKMIKKIKIEKNKKNNPLFYFGDPSNKFYIILKGEVRVYIKKNKKQIKLENLLNSKNLKTDNDNLSKSFIFDNMDNNLLFDKDYNTFLLKEVKIINKGEIFGEIGVRDKTTRKATIISTDLCIFATLNEKDFDQILNENEKKKLDKAINYYKNFFENNLLNDEIKFLSRYLTKINFKKNQYIIKEGNEIENIYILKRGRIDVLKKFKINMIDYPKYIKPDKNSKKEFLFESKNNSNKLLNDIVKENLIINIDKGKILGIIEFFDKKNYFENSYKVNSEKATVFQINIKNLEDLLIKFKRLEKFILNKKYELYNLLQDKVRKNYKFWKNLYKPIKYNNLINNKINDNIKKITKNYLFDKIKIINIKAHKTYKKNYNNELLIANKKKKDNIKTEKYIFKSKEKFLFDNFKLYFKEKKNLPKINLNN